MNIHQKILDTIPLFFFLWDREKKETIYLSEKFYHHRSQEYYAPNTPREDLRQYIHPDSQDIYDRFFNSLSKENKYHDRIELKAADNLPRILWMQLSTYPVDSQQEDTAYIAGHISDITHTKQDYQLLEEQVESLDTVTFLLAHELSAPITNIMGLAEMLKLKAQAVNFPARYLSFFDTIYNYSGEVLTLARGLISLIELQSSPTFVQHPISLTSFFQKVTDGVFLKSINKSVTLSYDTIPSTLTLKVQSEKFTRCLEALIVYLLKHHPAGNHVTITTISSDDHHLSLCLSAEGVKIPKKAAQSILDQPTRFKMRNVKGKTDNGLLELMIAKEIVDLHQGQLRLWEDTKAQGFIITLSQ